jgi:hypothetical protein
MHYVTDALGQQQAIHTYAYYEITQQGDTFTVRKGLNCGDDAVGVGLFAVTADFHTSWPSVVTRNSFTGRAGSSVANTGGCQVDFTQWYTVRGATVPYYLDPSRPLPTADQKATDTQPGWEDWDQDGNPGITGTISGAANGKIFVAPRSWTVISGTVPDVASKFKAPLQWNQEQNVMSYDGSALLGSEAARAADAKLHFVEFARLTDDQAIGDDQAICKSIFALAPMLTPVAAGN